MSWNNNIPSREEYTMHHLGTYELYTILDPVTGARVVKRSAPLLSRFLTLRAEPWSSQLGETLREIVFDIASLEVEVYGNGVFTTAIMRSKSYTGVGSVRKADKDSPNQPFASRLAVRRAFQSLIQQVDAFLRDTDLGRASMRLLDIIDLDARADQSPSKSDRLDALAWAMPDIADEEDCTEIVARPEGFDPKKREPVGYSLEELDAEKRALYPDDIPF